MPYSAEISRSQPSSFLLLVDQSGSMSDPFGAGEAGTTKASGAADAINRLLQNLVIKCAKSEGVRDYYHVGVIGYGQSVGSLLNGPLAGEDLVPISKIADAPKRIDERTVRLPDGAGGLVEQTVRVPVWVDAKAHGGTPMCAALEKARAILADWVRRYPNAYPPTVINVTDGEATDGDPARVADALRGVATEDGNVLLFNCHLSSHRAQPIVFHDSEDGLADNWARLLFRMSSTLPEPIRLAAEAERYQVSPASRGFAFNAELQDLIRFLDIGTRPGNLR